MHAIATIFHFNKELTYGFNYPLEIANKEERQQFKQLISVGDPDKITETK